MADRLILCSECGTKNRVGGDRAGRPTCGNCGKVLAVPGYSGAGKSQLSRSAFWFALGIASVVGVLYYNDPSFVQKLSFFGSNNSKPTYLETLPNGFILDSPPASNEQTNAQAPDLSEYGRPVEELPDTSKFTPSKMLPVRISTGVIKWPQSAIAPLEIKTTIGFNYFIKLIDSRGRSAMTIYIKGGEYFQTKVPLGTFEVRYATGQTWYGEEHLFGNETSRNKADKLFHYEQDYSYYLELIMQSDGNLPVRVISADEF